MAFCLFVAGLSTRYNAGRISEMASVVINGAAAPSASGPHVNMLWEMGLVVGSIGAVLMVVAAHHWCGENRSRRGESYPGPCPRRSSPIDTATHHESIDIRSAADCSRSRSFHIRGDVDGIL